jgi:hypothetical protein
MLKFALRNICSVILLPFHTGVLLQMKNKALPAIWCLSAAATAIGVFAIAHYDKINPFLTIALAWICSILVALFTGGVAVRIKPGLRFSTRHHTDGHGFIHQPFTIIVYVTVISVLALVVLSISFLKHQ